MLTALLARILCIVRFLARPISYLVVWLMMPMKRWAYCTRFRWLKRLLLEVTTLCDFVLVFANVQNPTMQIYRRVYRGNFIFGKAVMIIDHATARDELVQPSLRGNRFMGVDIVTNDPAVFVTNAGPITTGPPVRTHTRHYIDTQIMTERVHRLDLDTLRSLCADELREWSVDPKMATMWAIRGVVTRLTLRVLAEIAPSKADADRITFAYTRRFTEFSLFGRYCPVLLGLLGTREGIRRDAFLPLRQLGIDPMIIDMTLFAAMFSVGTIVIKCVEFAASQAIPYGSLPVDQRRRFVIEAQRLSPTVTSVHRIVEREERVIVRGRSIRLQPGDEVAYPLICINQDTRQFTDPEQFRLDRTAQEIDAVMSWSTGPHVCPAKELSILLTVLMLDELATQYDLRRLRIPNPEF